MEKIKIIGSGLTGPLISILLAQRGFEIELYEKRVDPRQEKLSAGRSINLALSERGIQALKKAKVFDRIEPILIPMKGRMIHHKNGDLDFQSYSINKNDYINSVSRAKLNKVLMSEAEERGNVKIHFNHELIEITENDLIFSNGNIIPNDKIIIGADGAGSQLRKYVDINVENPSRKEPLGHAYKELNIAPDKNGKFQLDNNCLHIWPRGEFMLIALPNTNKSFTCTLFMPNTGEISFESLQSDSDIINFFQNYFPDILPKLENFPQSFRSNPTGKLATIYTNKWNYKNILLIGDSAHAIVPFFGQGMNASFEDCSELINILSINNNNFNKTLKKYSDLRKPNTDSIAKMAIENYIEMRDSVAKSEFIKMNNVANLLYKKFPNRFIPRYNMVSFTSIPYNEVYKRGEIQKKIIKNIDLNNTDFEDLEKLINSKLPLIN
ncbi:MAG: kynurenine 3-monooxygenase [Candidatus Marinimicrobia bacterium]|nr:kynurenine 3-monooxygenase [Candidatus Neomarinimicrobiota bacterium]|tara:strand:+ start:2125 stop:3438 length:1314 start_codon:yes stop_codon:yes gene_type:complete